MPTEAKAFVARLWRIPQKKQMGGGVVWDVGLWQVDSKMVPNDPHFPVLMLLCNPLPLSVGRTGD